MIMIIVTIATAAVIMYSFRYKGKHPSTNVSTPLNDNRHTTLRRELRSACHRLM
jgi:hypothetical protein